VRFGFEYLSGLSGKEGLSNANKNAFTIDGKLYKLHTMDMTEGFDHPNHDGLLGNLTISMRKDEVKPDEPQCSIKFVKKMHMEVCANLSLLILCEMYGQGYISGTCSTGTKDGGPNRTFTLDNIDALLLWD